MSVLDKIHQLQLTNLGVHEQLFGKSQIKISAEMQVEIICNMILFVTYIQ